MSIWLEAVSNIGFPIVITLYLLSRIENKLDILNASIRELPKQLSHQVVSTADEERKSSSSFSSKQAK